LSQIEALSKDPDGRITEEEVTQLCAKAIEILEEVRPTNPRRPLPSPSPATTPASLAAVFAFASILILLERAPPLSFDSVTLLSGIQLSAGAGPRDRSG